MTDLDRDAVVDTLGNLTLLTQRLNSKVSNGPWSGEKGKRAALTAHDVLFLNRDLVEVSDDGWDEEKIAERTALLTDVVVNIWTVPEGHRSGGVQAAIDPSRRVELPDLIEFGLLTAGMTLYAHPKGQNAGQTATLLPDGQLDVNGTVFDSPSGAAKAISGSIRNGWRFFVVDEEGTKTLRQLWHDYVERLDIDVDDADVEEEDSNSDGEGSQAE